MSRFCKNCGASLDPNAKFCSSCGAILNKEATFDAKIRTRADTVARSVNSSEGGTSQTHIPGPLTYIKDSMRTGMTSLRHLLKDPKQLIPMLVLFIFWLILSILPSLGINPIPVKLLSFLTFAQGGMYAGVWGAVGGVIGKVVFAYFFSALILPLFKGQKPFKGMGSGVKRFFSGLLVQSTAAGSQLTIGIGLALITYNFLSGNASLVNSMAGLAGFVLAVRVLWRRAGFFWGLMLSAASKLSHGKVPSASSMRLVVTGYAAGSILGIAISAVKWPYHPITAYLPYMAGMMFFILGLVFGIAAKSKKEVVSA